MALALQNQLLVAKRLELESDCGRMIKQLDQSGDGSVDKCEYVVGMLTALEMVPKNELDELVQRFDLLDDDKSGVTAAATVPPLFLCSFRTRSPQLPMGDFNFAARQNPRTDQTGHRLCQHVHPIPRPYRNLAGFLTHNELEQMVKKRQKEIKDRSDAAAHRAGPYGA